MPDQMFRDTQNIVEKFGKPGGVGERLQKKLLERKDKKENWVHYVSVSYIMLLQGFDVYQATSGNK